MEIELREDFENSIEDAAMTYGLNIAYARSIAVRIFTREELQYALGVLT